ncbi:hypothetical protein PVK06_046554 [Gossypium arboreum]|uniref:Uncharacterized protein n=1 Tax=Gossypium arboreum TaxID=29729 RepID=A0ABR0MDH8_GOSAR|nr:hypothetical protein PVK06_046554 [Gossypium arboreum]
MRKMLKEISKAVPSREEVEHDVPNLDSEDPCFIVDHLEFDNSSQQEFEIGYNGDELNMAEAVSNLIDVEITITVKLTTNMELKSILNESVEEPIHFLAIVEKVPVEEIDKFNSFSFDMGNKARMKKTSRDMEGRKLEEIIPQKMIWA